MKSKDRQEFIRLIGEVAKDLAELPTEKERMGALKEFASLLQSIQPVVSALVFEEKENVRRQLLEKVQTHLDILKNNG